MPRSIPAAPQRWVFLFSAVACIAMTIAHVAAIALERADPHRKLLHRRLPGRARHLWLVFRDAFWAHMLVVAAVPVSFWPTWASVGADRAANARPPGGCGRSATSRRCWSRRARAASAVGEYAYILVELLCHASVWFMVGLATINPLRSLGLRNGRFYVLDAMRTPANLFAVGETHLGKAVFAAQAFAEGDR